MQVTPRYQTKSYVSLCNVKAIGQNYISKQTSRQLLYYRSWIQI